MRGVRFTKAELAAVFAAIDAAAPSAELILARAKLQASVAPIPAVKTLPVSRAIEAMEAVLGKGNVALPPHPDSKWFGRITNYINSKGFTEEDFTNIANGLKARNWAPPYSFEKAVYGADRLVAIKPGKSPVEMSGR